MSVTEHAPESWGNDQERPEDEATALLQGVGLLEREDTVQESTPEPGNEAVSAADLVPEPPEVDGNLKTSEMKAPRKAAKLAADESTPPSFADLGLSAEILKGIKDVGYEEPTPIQLITIPALLKGTDVIAQAQTGSGKTAAFGLPIIEQLDGRSRNVQAIVLTPTRELAIQVAEALHKYGREKRIETLPIYGGQPYERQFRGLQRGPQIVVGTPGRVMDHMRRGTLNLDSVRFFVLDEADEMLDMGFIEDIEWVLEHTAKERQTALFSATMPPRIARLATRYMNDPERLIIPGKQMTVPMTRQTYYEVPRQRKIDALTRILDAETPSLTMIFCRTKIGVDQLGEALQARGFAAETLHGDLSQTQRDRVMKRFRSGQADILVATDVAARGLDVPDVSHVINFDIPESPETYVHRIGRTGRAGRAGDAVTIVTPKETRWLRQVERTIKARIEPRRLPTAADVADKRRESLKSMVSDVLEADEQHDLYVQTITDLSEEHDLVNIAAAVLKLYADEAGKGLSGDKTNDELDIAIQSERPRRENTRNEGPRRHDDSNMARLFVNLGRNFSVRPQDIVGAIANEANIPGRSVGAIDIFDTYTFVDVPDDVADAVIAALIRSGIKGKSVNVERSQGGPSQGGGGRSGSDRRGGRDRVGGSAGGGSPYRGNQGGGGGGNRGRDARGGSRSGGYSSGRPNRRSDFTS